MGENNNLSFVDFYTKHDISPVQQDIFSLEKHFQRRESLYKILGIIPVFLKGKKIIEFGPGSGHNAIYTTTLNPGQYVLVDGNKRGIDECRENLEKTNINLSNISFVHSLFQDFTSNQKFDLVLAESCIPHQSKPIPLLNHISSFVCSGGGLVITTISGVSYLSEILRRFVRDIYIDPNADPRDQIDLMLPLLGPHLGTLKGMSRPVNDWLLDNIVQPLHKAKLLSIPEVIHALNDEFEFYSSSPKIVNDWRWYKDIIGKDRKLNELAINSYYKNIINFLDYRFVFPQHSREFGEMLEERCEKAWDLMCRFESGAINNWNSVWDLMQEIHAMIAEKAPDTAEALREAIEWLQNGAKQTTLKHFPNWWGRGSQYVSFVRK